mmetsp:Transcript_60734/g.130462  ORF Transcript_60734/g.130462 Transcript_60734/m.130462 type:complete len:200 (+) Transcript_60734:1134-1733(+)
MLALLLLDLATLSVQMVLHFEHLLLEDGLLLLHPAQHMLIDLSGRLCLRDPHHGVAVLLPEAHAVVVHAVTLLSLLAVEEIGRSNELAHFSQRRLLLLSFVVNRIVLLSYLLQDAPRVLDTRVIAAHKGIRGSLHKLHEVLADHILRPATHRHSRPVAGGTPAPDAPSGGGAIQRSHRHSILAELAGAPKPRRLGGRDA